MPCHNRRQYLSSRFTPHRLFAPPRLQVNLAGTVFDSYSQNPVLKRFMLKSKIPNGERTGDLETSRWLHR